MTGKTMSTGSGDLGDGLTGAIRADETVASVLLDR